MRKLGVVCGGWGVTSIKQAPSRPSLVAGAEVLAADLAWRAEAKFRKTRDAKAWAASGWLVSEQLPSRATIIKRAEIEQPSGWGEL